MFNMITRGSRFQPAALLTAVVLALGLAAPVGAATCSTSSVTTGDGIASIGCSLLVPLKYLAFHDTISVRKGEKEGETFSIAVTNTNKGNKPIAGTWSLNSGLNFAPSASYALALTRGLKTVFYKLDTSATSGTWSTADLLFFGIGKKYPGLAHATLVGTASPVPLPAAAWLLIGGMAGLGALKRRRRKAV